MDNLDRYYTPEDVAERIVSKYVSKAPNFCVDTTCGTGRLLDAISKTYKDAQCLGIDKDKAVINNLRKRRPNWHLASTDIFHAYATKIVKKLPIRHSCDLLVINPPFSMGKKKSFEVNYEGDYYSTSLAMAHVLRSFDLFKPNAEALVIVPESLLHSEKDKAARDALTRTFFINDLFSLERKTFSGTSVAAVVVKISKTECTQPLVKLNRYAGSQIKINLTRGGLPVHEHKSHIDGIPYVHTTDIRKIINDGIPSLKVVNPINRGRVNGWAILIPRVGIPKMPLLKLAKFEQELQLSDCVIALHSTSKIKMQTVEARILENWDEFIHLYKGTGARYISLSRLNSWFKNSLAIECC